jgi:deazaflavin-dependent oxidoreductase (nitroreductase family)
MPRRTPVGNGLDGDTFWIVAEHGAKAGYVRNIKHDPRVRVCVRQGFVRRWRTGTAQVLNDDDPRERQRILGRRHPLRAMNALAVRGFGTELLSIRVDLDA